MYIFPNDTIFVQEIPTNPKRTGLYIGVPLGLAVLVNIPRFFEMGLVEINEGDVHRRYSWNIYTAFIFLLSVSIKDFICHLMNTRSTGYTGSSIPSGSGSLPPSWSQWQSWSSATIKCTSMIQQNNSKNRGSRTTMMRRHDRRLPYCCAFQSRYFCATCPEASVISTMDSIITWMIVHQWASGPTYGNMCCTLFDTQEKQSSNLRVLYYFTVCFHSPSAARSRSSSMPDSTESSGTMCIGCSSVAAVVRHPI